MGAGRGIRGRRGLWAGWGGKGGPCSPPGVVLSSAAARKSCGRARPTGRAPDGLGVRPKGTGGDSEVGAPAEQVGQGKGVSGGAPRGRQV